MSTRSFIGMVNRDHTITSVYCHWDGYPEYNGKLLLEHYDNRAITRKLLHKGDFSSLQPKISDIQYYVDRGDEEVGAVKQTLDKFIEMCRESWCEYFYILKTDGTWTVSTADTPDAFHDLEDNLNTVDIEESTSIIACEAIKNIEVEQFLESVRTSIVKVEFEKADGSLTERHVTLAPLLVPDDKKPKSDEPGLSLDEMTEKDFVRVYSITDNDWRTVKPSKIKSYSMPEVEFANNDGKFVMSLNME